VSLHVCAGILRIYYENMNICIHECIQTCILTCRHKHTHTHTHTLICVESFYPHKKRGGRLLKSVNAEKHRQMKKVVVMWTLMYNINRQF
jgi:hypothetical protein